MRRAPFSFPRACLPILAAPFAFPAMAWAQVEDWGQSILHPAGEDAAAIADLFWIMTIGGTVIWTAVLALTLFAVRTRKPRTERFADRFILIAGVVFPTVTLGALLVVGLALLPGWAEEDAPDLRVHVTGEQFWWRITYEMPDGTMVETANELHLPVDAEIEFTLTSTDVIHSFWIPVLGGKMDMIPGRETTLRLRPTAIGTYRGVCAEYCGLSHALMAMIVHIEEPADFARWLAHEAGPAPAPPPPAWAAAGCGACHVLRGVEGGAAVGPDLTHLAARETLAAGILPMDPQVLDAWISNPEAHKPDARMPAFAHLDAAARAEIVSYLMRLE